MSLRRSALAAAAVLALAGAAGCNADSVLDLQVGDCLNESELQEDEVRSVPTVDCSEEHDAEIFAEHVFEGEDYPGEEAVTAESQDVCIAEFEEFIGVPYLESELLFTMLYPSEQSWDDSEDRTTLCIVLSEEPMTGSLAGAGV